MFDKLTTVFLSSELLFWLTQLRYAFLIDNYARQAEIAEKLLPYEKTGAITNELLFEILR